MAKILKGADGIRTSQRPPGRLASRWLATVETTDERLKGRWMRGRTLSRAGRVQQLEIAPGAVYAEIADPDPQRPTVRVRTFDEHEWDDVLGALGKSLVAVAKLIEGEVARDMLAALEERGIALVPPSGDVEADCDCGDWAVPCAHAAALHHVIGEALDGDPFLLFTLRGRPRDQLLGHLRRTWGDKPRRRMDSIPLPVDEPDGDPFTSPIALPPLSFRFSENPSPPAMFALGPLLGDEDLGRGLQPLYDAGAAAALATALADARPDAPRRRRRSVVPHSVVPTHTSSAPKDLPTEELTEQLVDLIASAESGAAAADLAKRIGLSEAQTQEELVELASLGLVYATSEGGAALWWLG